MIQDLSEVEFCEAMTLKSSRQKDRPTYVSVVLMPVGRRTTGQSFRSSASTIPFTDSQPRYEAYPACSSLNNGRTSMMMFARIHVRVARRVSDERAWPSLSDAGQTVCFLSFASLLFYSAVEHSSLIVTQQNQPSSDIDTDGSYIRGALCEMAGCSH